MSDLPPLDRSVRVTLSVNALVAVVILLIVAFSGGGTAEAFAVAGLYFVGDRGWSAVQSVAAAARAAGRSTTDGSG